MMEELKFKGTPGPWYAPNFDEGWRNVVRDEDEDDVVAIAKGANKERVEFNAKLIAAAPEMLDVCIQLLEFMSQAARNHMEGNTDGVVESGKNMGKLYSAAYRAVKKALEE